MIGHKSCISTSNTLSRSSNESLLSSEQSCLGRVYCCTALQGLLVAGIRCATFLSARSTSHRPILLTSVLTVIDNANVAKHSRRMMDVLFPDVSKDVPKDSWHSQPYGIRSRLGTRKSPAARRLFLTWVPK